MAAERSAQAQDLLESIFRVATGLVRGERASLMLREDNSTDFVIACAIGLAKDVQEHVRVRPGEGIAGRVAETKQPLLGHAGGADSERPTEYRTGSYMSVPIVVDDESRGVLNVTDRADGEPFGLDDLATLTLLASHIGTCLVEQEGRQALQLMAQTDALTGLFDRRHFDQRLEAETSRSQRGETMLALLMLDIDRFKSINDRYGHRAGDHVLRVVALAVKQAVRLYDVPTRIGGDEIAVILPDADSAAATRVARRIIEKTAAAALPPAMAAAGERIGLSIGVATFPRPAVEGSALVECADAAMYRAKQDGGGVRVWEHSFAERKHQRRESAADLSPYLAEPSRLATPRLQSLLPAALATEWNAVVVGQEGQVLTIAMPRPDASAIDALSKATGCAVYPVYSNAADLEGTRRRLAEMAAF